MKISPLALGELALFSLFFGLAFSGQIQEFDQIVFFEPEFTYILIAMSVMSGMLIGSLYERYTIVEKEPPCESKRECEE